MLTAAVPRAMTADGARSNSDSCNALLSFVSQQFKAIFRFVSSMGKDGTTVNHNRKSKEE
jgi:hypothetical protein